MDLPNNHVDIRIDDLKKYLDVCSLVDRPDFITDMLTLRKKWKIAKPYPRIKNKPWTELLPFKEQIPKEKNFVKKYLEAKRSLQFMKEMFMLKDAPEKDIGYKERVMSEFKQNKSWRRFPDLYFAYDTMELRKKYQKPPNFDQIVICAALYSCILPEDYKTCEIGLSFAGNALWQPFHESVPSISFYPLVNLDDIINLFQKEGEKILKDYQKKYIKGMVTNKDVVSNIKRNRRWYWLKKSGLSYSKIYEKAKATREFISEEGIIRAIKRYQRLLTTDI